MLLRAHKRGRHHGDGRGLLSREEGCSHKSMLPYFTTLLNSQVPIAASNSSHPFSGATHGQGKCPSSGLPQAPLHHSTCHPHPDCLLVVPSPLPELWAWALSPHLHTRCSITFIRVDSIEISQEPTRTMTAEGSVG